MTHLLNTMMPLGGVLALLLAAREPQGGGG